MAAFSESIDINATPAEVWAVLGDLSAVGRWIPGVTAVIVEGMRRVCTFEDGHRQDEQILDYSPTARSFRYRIDGAPLPVTDNTGSFTVQHDDGVTRVVWESSFQPLDAAMSEQLAQMWQPYLPMALGNLKQVIEDGRE